MADDKKNIPEAAPPAEAPAPTVEKAAVPEPPAPDPVLTDAEAVMLEQEGQAALFEMGEAVPDPADAVTLAEVAALVAALHNQAVVRHVLAGVLARKGGEYIGFFLAAADISCSAERRTGEPPPLR